MGRVLFIFLDGVGIGPRDPASNPFFQAKLPTLTTLIGGEMPHLDAPERSHGDCVAFPLDPLLGVEGLPQSGTGHTALLTGENGPRLYGRHFGPWVPVRLRPLVEERNVLTRAQAKGHRCAFANAYPKEFHGSPWARRPAGPLLAAVAAGLLTREAEALGRGDALSSEIVNSAWRTRLGYTNLPEITPLQAGRNLAGITEGIDLTFFAHYATDYAGHSGKMTGATRALERVDTFLTGVLERLSPEVLLVVASDHGNLEDIRSGHTLNPAFTLLKGPMARTLREGKASITDIPGLILTALSTGRKKTLA
ncbi:MAG: alkaline phosphatase family protein [Longimicrobiales bacterium]